MKEGKIKPEDVLVDGKRTQREVDEDEAREVRERAARRRRSRRGRRGRGRRRERQQSLNERKKEKRDWWERVEHLREFGQLPAPSSSSSSSMEDGAVAARRVEPVGK